MKRHVSRQRWAMMLATCVMPVLCCARACGCYAEPSAVARSWTATLRDSLQSTHANVVPASTSTAYFGDVPFTVVGVYGATMLDMLSGGPMVLVRWPDGCCSSKQRWHTRRAISETPGNANAHIFFLWPES